MQATTVTQKLPRCFQKGSEAGTAPCSPLPGILTQLSIPCVPAVHDLAVVFADFTSRRTKPM